jgi:drug/metabolite transporter (DMT)-like permease
VSDKALGVILAVAAALCFEGSYLLLAAQARRVERARRPGGAFLAALARRPLWLLAMGLNGVAFGLELVALRLASVIVVQPVLAFGLVGLVAAAGLILGEHVGPGALLAAGAVSAGVALVIIGGPKHTAGVRLGHAIPAVIVLGGVAVVVAVPYVRREAGSPWRLVAAAAAGDTLVAVAANEVARAGTGRPLAAVLWVLAVAVAGIAAVTCESAALQQLPAFRVAPIVSSVQAVLPVLLLGVLGRSHWNSTPHHGLMLAAGLILTASGAFVLGRSRLGPLSA